MIIHTCDICQKEMIDEFEIQEMFHINHDCGYGSVFGDGAKVQYDICQKCMKEMLTHANANAMRKYVESLNSPPSPELIKNLIEKHKKEEEDCELTKDETEELKQHIREKLIPTIICKECPKCKEHPTIYTRHYKDGILYYEIKCSCRQGIIGNTEKLVIETWNRVLKNEEEALPEPMICPKCGKVNICACNHYQWRVSCDCSLSSMIFPTNEYTRNDVIKKWNEEMKRIKGLGYIDKDPIQECINELHLSEKCNSCANLFKNDFTCFSCSENPAKTTLTTKQRFNRYIPIVSKPPYRDNY